MYIDHKQHGVNVLVSSSMIVRIHNSDEKKKLINNIYAPTEKDAPPSNDIGVFMNKETSPEVANFIHNNLHQEQEPTVTESALDADEDDIIDGTPRRYETVNQFEKRVSDKLNAEKAERTNKRLERQIKESLLNK